MRLGLEDECVSVWIISRDASKRIAALGMHTHGEWNALECHKGYIAFPQAHLIHILVATIYRSNAPWKKGIEMINPINRSSSLQLPLPLHNHPYAVRDITGTIEKNETT